MCAYVINHNGSSANSKCANVTNSKGSSNNLPSYPPDSHQCQNAVYLRMRGIYETQNLKTTKI